MRQSIAPKRQSIADALSETGLRAVSARAQAVATRLGGPPEVDETRKVPVQEARSQVMLPGPNSKHSFSGDFESLRMTMPSQYRSSHAQGCGQLPEAEAGHRDARRQSKFSGVATVAMEEADRRRGCR